MALPGKSPNSRYCGGVCGSKPAYISLILTNLLGGGLLDTSIIALLQISFYPSKFSSLPMH